MAAVQRSVGRLRDFKRWLDEVGVRATFAHPDELGRKVGAALRDWRERHGGAARFTPAPRTDPGRYLRALERDTAWISIRGLGVGSGKAHRFPIGDFYMALTTTGPAGGPQRRTGSGRRKDDASRLQRPAPVPLTTALSHRRLVVVGDPGSGKSTFLRRVANALCRARSGDDPAACRELLGIEDAPFPILVRLADLADHVADTRRGTAATRPATANAAAWLWHFLAARSADEGWGLDAEFFRGQIERGRCLILLDGLDEAPDRQARAALARLIERLALRFWHLTFQEFLAARAIAEMVLLLSGVLHEQGRPKVDGLVAGTLDTLGTGPSLADQARAAGLLGAVVRDLAPFGYAPADRRYEECGNPHRGGGCARPGSCSTSTGWVATP